MDSGASTRGAAMKDRVAFLFLGETLLIPHLWPIAEALALAEPDLPIDLWVSTSLHEALIGGWAAALDRPNLRIGRAPGFRSRESEGNLRLPAKLPMLARLAPRLARTRVAVCAEQTSLWLAMLAPLPTRFVKTSHGVGSMSARDDRRRRAAWRTLVPSERERQTYLERGMDPGRIVATGYVKAGFRQRTNAELHFPEAKPVILYTPHWQRYRSSWWAWGRALVERLAAQSRYNVILAPHQRLVERAPDVRSVLRSVAGLPHIRCDLDSFATVDGSYTAAADIFLGDTSSQVVEFLMRPRPAIFLDSHRTAWQDDPSYTQWHCGEVVTDLAEVMAAIDRAPAEHPRFAATQASFAEASLGDSSGHAPARAAAEVMTALKQA